MFFPFFLIGLVFQLVKWIAFATVIVLCIALVKNTARHPSYTRPPVPPPCPGGGAPHVVYVQRRNFGCMSFLGTCAIIVIIFLGVRQSARHDHRPVSEADKRLQEISQQKRDLDRRIETEIPEFVHLLFEQAKDIKNELNATTEASKKDYLMEELQDIARTFVFLDQEENDYKNLLSELSSIERTLIRLKESEKLFGTEYNDFMEQSRTAMAKAKAKLNVKIKLQIEKDVSLNELDIQDKIDELLK